VAAGASGGTTAPGIVSGRGGGTVLSSTQGAPPAAENTATATLGFDRTIAAGGQGIGQEKE
jgi:hypothetical protein